MRIIVAVANCVHATHPGRADARKLCRRVAISHVRQALILGSRSNLLTAGIFTTNC